MKEEILKRPVSSVGEKFDFLNQVFSNPQYRTKQKASPLTPIRAAVACKIAQYFNKDKGYSFVSERRIAEEIKCSQAAVNKALKWLELSGHIERIDEGKANTVSRYVIFLQNDHHHKSYYPDKSHKNNRADNFHRNTRNEKSHKNGPKGINGTQVKLNGNGPSRCGPRREAAGPARDPFDIDKAMEYLGR